MEQPYAEASCILKVNVHCQACKFRILEVLGSICGEYNIDINAEEGLVRVYALVEPNLLMKALARTGYHAELKWAKLQHPRLSRNYYDNDHSSSYNYRHRHNYGAIDNYPYSHSYSHNNPYGYSRGLPDPYSSYPPQNYSTPSHYYNNGWSNACGRSRPFGY